MQLTYTPEQERLRQELRDYFAGLMTAEVREALTTAEGEYGNGEAYRQVVRQLGPAAASATKVFGTEFATEAYRLLMEVLGANAHVREGSAGAVLSGRIERMHRAAEGQDQGGGTNEVQRDIIAAAGLGLPIRR